MDPKVGSSPNEKPAVFGSGLHMAMGQKRLPRTCEMSGTLLSLACAGTGVEW